MSRFALKYQHDHVSKLDEIPMKPPVVGYWAKLHSEDSQIVEWLPVLHHCADVAACAEAVLRVSILCKRLARSMGREELTSSQRARIAALIAMHDAGKFCVGFQNRAWPDRQPRTGHLQVLASVLGAPFDFADVVQALRLEELCEWSDVQPSGLEGIIPLLASIISHHGYPVSIDRSFDRSVWKPPRMGQDPIEGLRSLGEALERWFPEAFASDADPLPSSTTFQHALNGLVTLVDWIGSDPSTDFFDFNRRDGEPIIESRERAERVIFELGLDAERWRKALSAPAGFSSVSHHTPRPTQACVLEQPLHRDGSLTILESDTGSGKTEAALARFVQLLEAGHVDGMYFALPTRTAAIQIFERTRQAIRRAFPDDPPPVVLAVPGYLRVDAQEGRRLARFDVLWDEDESSRWRFRGWAAEGSKRYLAGTVVIGTIDQVLLSTLQVKHAHMRATALMRLFLIVDEVHASDTYMTTLLSRALDLHLQCGGHAFLMSATLGSASRDAFLRRLGITQETPLEAAKNLDYPLVTHVNSRQPHHTATRPENDDEDEESHQKHIHIELAARMGAPCLIASQALDAARRGAKVLVIRNTVRGCIETQRELEALASAHDRAEGRLLSVNALAVPHHSRYAGVDREQLDRAIEARLGRDAPNGKGCVAIATQTVQQSLDLDADLMITDICPVDVLLQRVGRLHRHADRPRPDGFSGARAIVLTPEERSLESYIRERGPAFGPHGLGTVYPDLRIIEATWRALEVQPDIAIPRDNRALVESATHPEALRAIVHELSGRWPAHESACFGATTAEGQLARLNSVDRSRQFGFFQFVSNEESARICTRLGENDRLVRFEEALTSPLGQRLWSLSIPGWLVERDSADPDGVPEAVDTSEPGIITFRFAHIDFRYDRHGLHRVDGQEPPIPT